MSTLDVPGGSSVIAQTWKVGQRDSETDGTVDVIIAVDLMVPDVDFTIDDKVYSIHLADLMTALGKGMESP